MLYLSFIWHMHQPYYLDMESNELHLPWVRLHGIKDYLDMVKILEDYPDIHQTFNLVPSLIEQINAYIDGSQDTLQKISYKKTEELNSEEKQITLERFFSAHLDNAIKPFPRYYQLYLQKQAGREFNTQDYLDLQVWFNLSWFDYTFKKSMPELKNLISKARSFTHEDKLTVLSKQIEILKDIIPTYRKLQDNGQIEVSTNPYYHPIIPLLCDTNTAKEADISAMLPETRFEYPEDAQAQIEQAIGLYRASFGRDPQGMWPSEEAVSEAIVPLIIKAGIKWIISDEAILFRSLKKRRSEALLYKPYTLKRREGEATVIFRDRNLSDLIGFDYYNRKEADGVADFIKHLHNIAKSLKNKNALVVVAMDGENAWEYYRNDGWDFLNLLYKSLSADQLIRTATVSEYLKDNPPAYNIKHLSCGSWIYGNFAKWIGQKQKNMAWEYLKAARDELEHLLRENQHMPEKVDFKKAFKQIYILEGSDWFWWYGDNNQDFDYLFRKHMRNLYNFIGKPAPEYLNKPI